MAAPTPIVTEEEIPTLEKLTLKVVGATPLVLEGIKGDMTVLQLKEKVVAHTDKLTMDTQKIFYKGKVLVDTDTLMAKNVPNNATLLVTRTAAPTTGGSSSSSSGAAATDEKKKEECPVVDDGPPQQCKGGCGFFGNKNFDWYCSKCYNEKLEKERKEMAEIGKKKEEDKKPGDKKPSTGDNANNKDKDGRETEPDADGDVKMEAVVERPKQENKSRCWKCNKKIPLTCLDCKCGYRFCPAHRLPEEHDCDYDFKSEGRDVLRKQNNQVVADKVEKL